MRRKDREVTSRNGIEEILLLCKTCHIAMIDGDIPYVVPLSFGYKFISDSELELYFHSAHEGRKIDVLKKNNKVCFEMSCEGEPARSEIPCDSGYYFSSVIGNGQAIFVEEITEKCEALSAMFKHQMGRDITFDGKQADSVCVFKVVSSDFTGKKKLKPHSAG